MSSFLAIDKPVARLCRKTLGGESLRRAKQGPELPASLSQRHLEAGTDIHRQTGIAERGDVLIVGQIVSLAVQAKPREELVASPKIKLGESIVQVAVGKKETVSAVGVGKFEIG